MSEIEELRDLVEGLNMRLGWNESQTEMSAEKLNQLTMIVKDLIRRIEKLEEKSGVK